MIQKADHREQETYTTANQDGLDEFGRWVGTKYYSLDMVQHPLRARMCGFGDKDRRPLAPAAVAKMVVRRQDNSVVDVEEVDCSFFIVTVDLWSADGKQQANLVLHPTSTDRFAPSHSPPKLSKGRSTADSTPTPRQGGTSGNHTPQEHTPPTSGPRYRPDEQFTNQGPYAAQQESDADNATYPHDPQYGSPPSPAQATPWVYNSSPVDRNVAYPQSIQTYTRQTNSESAGNWPPNSTGSAEVYRDWNTEPTYTPVDNYSNSDPNVDLTLRTPSSSETLEGRSGKAPWPQANTYNANNAPNADRDQGPMYGQTMFQQGSYNPYSIGSPASLQPTTLTVSALPRHSYTRTLVGPLSANACRLMDEHRKPGIFFLFQDLSVRTEGIFRLRMRLMNVGAPPAPEIGAQRVHNDVSPVLAQVFTEPFTVFSAKRFPGVPDTTALSIALGNQGQKLPLRNRHGTTAKRRRRDESESEDDSE